MAAQAVRLPALLALIVAVGMAGVTGCQRQRSTLTARQSAAPDAVHQLAVGGLVRSYVLHQPAGTASMAGLPVVLAFAGGFGTGPGMASLTHLDEVADQHRFIVVYPDGYQRSWNDGRGNTPAARAGVNDVAFAATIISSLITSDHVDARRVYATGISNGGMLTELLGCDLAGKLAAIAPVAGPMPAAIAPGCHPARAVPVLVIHGTNDPIIPYGGGHVNGRGGGGTVLSAPATAARWRILDGCGNGTITRALPDRAQDGTTVTSASSTRCRDGASVAFYTVQGGGHTWPGGLQYLPRAIVGATSRQFDASQLIWQFFASN